MGEILVEEKLEVIAIHYDIAVASTGSGCTAVTCSAEIRLT